MTLYQQILDPPIPNVSSGDIDLYPPSSPHLQFDFIFYWNFNLPSKTSKITKIAWKFRNNFRWNFSKSLLSPLWHLVTLFRNPPGPHECHVLFEWLFRFNLAYLPYHVLVFSVLCSRNVGRFTRVLLQVVHGHVPVGHPHRQHVRVYYFCRKITFSVCLKVWSRGQQNSFKLWTWMNDFWICMHILMISPNFTSL